MAVKGFRLKVNSDGVRALLTSQAVADDLIKRAKSIADAAGGSEAGFEAVQTGGPSRARAIVITTTYEAKAREARDRALTRSIGAGG